MVLSCLLLLTAPQTSAPVTLTVRATTVQRAVEKLAKATRLPLQVSPSMTEDIVLLSVRDIPASRVMKTLAQACSAEWTESKGTWYLGPAAGLRNREAQIARERRIQALRQAAAKASSSTSDAGDEVFIAPFLRFVDLGPIADLAPGDRAVFSDQPTLPQKPFSGLVTPLIQKVVRAHDEMAALEAQANSYDLDTDAAPASQEQRNQRALRAMIERRISSVSRSVFSVAREIPSIAQRSVYRLTLRLFDGKGNVVDVRETIITADVPSPTPTTPPGDKQTPIKWSDATKNYLECVREGKALPLPDEGEPLGFGPTDAVFASATAHSSGVVACLPDQVALPVQMASEALTVETFESVLPLFGVRRTDTEPGLMLLTPADPDDARRTRMPRAVTAKLLREGRSRGYAGLEAIADAFPLLRQDDPTGLGQIYLREVPGLESLLSNDPPNRKFLALYTSLRPDQRSALWESHRLSLAELSESQRNVVENIAYSLAPDFTFGTTRPVDTASYPWSDIRAEPTLLLPEGLPRDGWIEARATSEPAALRNDRERLDILTLTDVKQLHSAGIAMSKLRAGTRRTLQLRLVFRPGLSKVGELLDHQFESGRKEVGYDELPPEFRTP